MLPDEEKTFRDLKDKSDRAEFQKIFWARRDPDLETPDNEYQAEYEPAKAEADTQVSGSAARPASQTDCGRVFILLGKPDEVKKDQMDGASRRGAGARDLDLQGPARASSSRTGRSRSLRRELPLPQGGALRRPAQPPGRGQDRRIRTSATGARTAGSSSSWTSCPSPRRPGALKAPRQDFAAAPSTSMFLRSPGGASYVAGLVRGDPAVAARTRAARRPRRSCGRAGAGRGGQVRSSTEREADGRRAADGSSVVVLRDGAEARASTR